MGQAVAATNCVSESQPYGWLRGPSRATFRGIFFDLLVVTSLCAGGWSLGSSSSGIFTTIISSSDTAAAATVASVTSAVCRGSAIFSTRNCCVR